MMLSEEGGRGKLERNLLQYLQKFRIFLKLIEEPFKLHIIDGAALNIQSNDGAALLFSFLI